MTLLKEFVKSIVGGTTMLAFEAADTISGGHIKEAAKTSGTLFNEEVSKEIQNAAIEALDLARLNNSRLKPIIDLLAEMETRVHILEDRWQGSSGEKPQFRDFVAGCALVSVYYVKQSSGPRRRLILDALTGSFCPDPYMFGFQDELLRSMMESNLNDGDVSILSNLQTKPIQINVSNLHTCVEIDGLERLSQAKLVNLTSKSSSNYTNPVRNRYDLQRDAATLIAQITISGSKFLSMVNQGREVREQSKARHSL